MGLPAEVAVPGAGWYKDRPLNGRKTGYSLVN
jgi:hypothetical protein